MPPDRVSGERFDGSADSEPSRQKHRPLPGKLVAHAIGSILAVLVPLAYASPPDPIWIAGIYDNADYDDVVGLVTDETAISSGHLPELVEQQLVAFALHPAARPLTSFCRELKNQLSFSSLSGHTGLLN